MLVETITADDDGFTQVTPRHQDLIAVAATGPRLREIALDYQPIHALQSGAACGLEAITRRTASCDRLGDLLAQACVEARYWPGFRMSVRISPQQLESEALLDLIDAALAMSGLSPAHLDLEVVESKAINRALPRLLALRKRGLGVVLGEFGRGGCSLPLLRHLPLTAIKLDRRLVRALPLDAKACARARLLLDACRIGGIQSIADGVETLAQREFLRRNGAAAAQGSLYSRPLAPERLAVLLDYGLDTCSAPRSTSETRDDRAVPH